MCKRAPIPVPAIEGLILRVAGMKLQCQITHTSGVRCFPTLCSLLALLGKVSRFDFIAEGHSWSLVSQNVDNPLLKSLLVEESRSRIKVCNVLKQARPT